MTVLSQGWAGASHRLVRSAQTTEQRLALAISPIRSIIRVIDSHVPAMSADWARVGKDDKDRPLSISFTDFKGGRIAVNPLPILHGGDLGAAMDVAIGFGLHEASHAEESRDRYGDLIVKKTERNRVRGQWREWEVESPAFHPFRVAIWLWNLVEDVRIEAETSRKWPGSRPYFERVLDWMWKQRPVEIKDFASSKVEDRMKIVFLACRFPDMASPSAGGWSDDEKAEIAWWQEWQADYLAGRTDVRETIQRGLDHLALDEVTSQEMLAMEAEERQEQKHGEKARAQLDRLLRDGIGDAPVCITEDGEVVPLTAEQAEAVDKLLREEFESHKPLFTDNGNHCAEVRVTKPEETQRSRQAYVGKPTPLVEALRSSLVFRQAKPQWDLKLQKSGHLDDEELWRLSTDDVRVFSERVIEARQDVALGLLVDMSGSMAGTHLRTAQRLAQTFLWAVQDDEGVECHIWGHTGDLDRSDGSDIFRIWEPGDPVSRLGLVTVLPHGDNYDGFAIAHCVTQMKEMSQPQKALIVLSDGYPAGEGYGDVTAQRHMRHVVDWAERQGVDVFQIAIDDELRAADQERMFGPGRWLPYSTDARLPRDLTKLLARLT